MVTFTRCLGFLASLAAVGVHGLAYHCADFSSLLVNEAAGITYTDNGVPERFDTILANHGANLARIRVWTAGDYNLSAALAVAKRAQGVGMQLLVDLHYSDSWADPGKQYIPSSWPTDLAGLLPTIYNYTRDLVMAFNAQGTPITFLQIGNEINSGILWPVGEISQTGYGPLSQLLHSGVMGARAGSSTLKTMIHLANGWDLPELTSWYQGVLSVEGGLTLADVDTMGFSFYPFYGTGATLSALQTSMMNITQTYRKNFMIVETDWPAVCSGVALSEPSIPASVPGQETWVEDIRNTLQNVVIDDGENGMGVVALGICYWEPGWIGNAALGSGCQDNLLVDSAGATRPSISMFSLDM
ncbi:glycosyl hydrolase 53 [Gloeophyllum trabeum ATCC 11539]|uniref:Arabinogalactan endo-beta-1,4-galactanase n=1 Tax=Gloeophyllum trabeum (strain ATCC 11539 / FP-39264 / Madison 617) TaxID=670483 RepID=S7Q0W5_GLOTA|nr:glycosyl hydrolase 53 [Gloeophyllum trabeum ATCC 11539]EPQ53581.1 glycosyl hydrolase 53 [Gloeophyllum trabeum ATCC 11539]